MSQELTPAELAAFRARQRSRSRALGLILVALAVLFFAITLVKIKHAADLRHAQAAAPAAQGAPAEH
jgi:hypothetical protein